MSNFKFQIKKCLNSQREFVVNISKLGSKGFTLIEIIIVFTVLAILSVIGVASFTNYSRTQTLDNEAKNLGNAITVARSNALSQVKGNSVCSGNTLSGYQIQVYTKTAPSKANTYELSAVCSNNIFTLITQYKIAPNISIESAAPGIFRSPVITGGITPGIIVLSGYSKTKTITVKPDGRIDIQ